LLHKKFKKKWRIKGFTSNARYYNINFRKFTKKCLKIDTTSKMSSLHQYYLKIKPVITK
jgi:hypothetical protein